ncbi:MAG TPA: Na+/H+ antiporter subunit D [Metalysinibacillus jejuensis]|uniref:Na+/H+ antiporter subunit D n=1 Tax=Metalysinibacillus jejuensis TaxID=914327 RepID=A0A921NB40_9BACL|nr:Na+/H+ antiporter subunit D [Metalysinibacillus jejuensis]HJH10418.1 Na+/H+ antiporter subunit D [Metalysinibacillus jejuensis]
MNNMIVFPLILPIMTAILLVFFRHNIILQRIVSIITMAVVTIISAVIVWAVPVHGILRLDFSGWQPPYGILFVADSFAALLVFTASLVTTIILLYATCTIGEKRERNFFYTFVLLMIAGVNGSFLTGDIFNLFVCFEVMLLASYVLITLGGERVQLRESIKYVLINVVASWLFLVALAYLYSTLGTLNMAHIALRVTEAGQGPLLTTVSLVFLAVFALKAGLLLFQWLPGSYSAPPPAVAALFAALLTKVGIYALFRTYTLMFTHDALPYRLIGIMAMLTIIAGCLGALSGRDVRTIAVYNVLIGVGFILLGLAIGTEVAFQGAIYYVLHDIIAKAFLFLCIGTMIYLTGETVIDQMSGLIRNYPVFGWLFFIVMCALAGIPPLSGFIGKVLIAQAAVAEGDFLLIAVGLASSIIVLYSLLRIFLSAFFGETIIPLGEEMPLPKTVIWPIIMLALLTIALGVGAQAIANYVVHAAEVLANPTQYIDAVLPEALKKGM